MKTHLTHDQFVEALIGENPRTAAQHLASCSQCQGELATMKEALGGFRDSVHNWSYSQPRSVVAPRKAFRWSLVAAAVAIATAIPVYRTVVEQRRIKEAAEDARLLEQVDLQLSRVVPTPIEPLVDLLPEDGELR